MNVRAAREDETHMIAELSDAHAREAKLNLERTCDRVSVLEVDEVHRGPGGRLRLRDLREHDRDCDRRRGDSNRIGQQIAEPDGHRFLHGISA